MSSDSAVAILFDGYGNQVAVINRALETVSLSTTGTITSVAAVNSDTLLLSANANRRGLYVYNDTTSAKLYLGFSTSTITTTNFSVQLVAGGVFEIPFGYTGQLRGMWTVTEADGYALLTELT